MRTGLLLAATLLYSVIGAFGQSQGSVTGSWQALFRDSLSSGTLTFDLESRRKGSIGGTYRTSTGKSGTVTGRQKRLSLDLTLKQEGSCPGYYSVTLQLAEGTGSGTYSGSDCLGEHNDGVISMASTSSNLSPPPLPAPLDISDYRALFDAGVEQLKRQREAEETQRKLDQAKVTELEADNKIKAVEAEEASIRLGYLKHQSEYLDDVGNLDPADPQYKTKLDLLQLKIKLVSEALSGLPPESPSEAPTGIPTPPGAKKPMNQVQVISLLAGQVPSHRVALLVNERGIDFQPQDDYLQQVRLNGGDEELIGTLKSAKVFSPSGVR
jgi:hypothetical protein